MKYLMICFVMLISLSSCSKEDIESKLPPETTTGKNTAGFIVDGKTVVLPSNSVSSVPGNGTIYGLSVRFGQNFGTNGDDYFTVRIANVADKVTYGIRLRMNNLINGEGIYYLGQSNGEYYSDGPAHPQIILILSGNDKETKWYYSSDNSGSIIMTKVDTENDYYAGTFECTLYNKDNPTETIKIAKGRFDINVKTLDK